MLRVVADTNVLISAFIAEGPPNRFFRLCIEGRVIPVISPRMLEELAGVLRRPKFKLSPPEVLRVVQIVAETAEIVDAHEHRGIVQGDPDDDAIMSAAIDGRAAYVVTGDKALLALAAYEGIEIMPVAKFLKQILKEGQGRAMRGCAITYHSSRRRFAARLNSVVMLPNRRSDDVYDTTIVGRMPAFRAPPRTPPFSGSLTRVDALQELRRQRVLASPARSLPLQDALLD